MRLPSGDQSGLARQDLRVVPVVLRVTCRDDPQLPGVGDDHLEAHLREVSCDPCALRSSFDYREPSSSSKSPQGPGHCTFRVLDRLAVHRVVGPVPEDTDLVGPVAQVDSDGEMLLGGGGLLGSFRFHGGRGYDLTRASASYRVPGSVDPSHAYLLWLG